MDGIDILLEYLNVFKELEINYQNDEHILKDINKLIILFEDAKSRMNKIKYFDEYEILKKIITRYDANLIYKKLCSRVLISYNLSNEDEIKTSNKIPSHIKEILNNYTNKGADNILYDIMLNISRYNLYFMNKKPKSYELPIDADIKEVVEDEEISSIDDVLAYIDAEKDGLDKKLKNDLEKHVDVEKFKNNAIEIKTALDMSNAVYEKIEDKNVLASILLHSDLETIKNICNNFSKNGVDSIKSVVDNISSIFIKEPINSKCKYNIPFNYDNFIKNVELIENEGLDFKKMIKFPAFLVNDSTKNVELVDRLKDMGVNVKNVLEHIAGIFVTKPNVVFKNINILPLYGVSLTDDENNNGYTLLGMSELETKLDYLIEQGEWKKNDGEILDNIDLIRGLIIRDDYLKWKNNYKYDKLDSTSPKLDFTDEPYSEEKLQQMYNLYPDMQNIIEVMDNTYWNKEEVFYSVGLNRISRMRILRNLCNYKGKEEKLKIFKKVLMHKSNINNSEEVFKAICQTLEMGDEDVKLSKGL